MKIFVDARMMGSGTSRGIGRVIYELLARLLRDSQHEWVVLVRQPAQMEGLTTPSQLIVADIPWYGFREQIQLPWIIARVRPDRAFFPHWNVPFLLWTPFVCFIHDLILFHLPESAKVSTRHPLYARFKQMVQRILVRWITWRAQAIIVPTQVVAQDIQHIFPRIHIPVSVVGEGITPLPRTSDAASPLNPYFLTVGSAYPHKRLDLVLQAWKRLAPLYPLHRLVLVGENDVFRARLQALTIELDLPRVEFPGQVSDERLATWYAHADLLLFPSEDEGFGLPPLEALSLGCPVLASDIPVLKEVLPTSGVRFFRNGDLNDMIEMWNALMRDRALVAGATEAGFASAAKRFNWDQVAQRVHRCLTREDASNGSVRS